MRTDSLANPYVVWVRKINPQILCRTRKPDPLFTGQVRTDQLALSTLKMTRIKIYLKNEI